MAPPVKFGVGQSVLRKEDDALIRGKGRYTDDYSPLAALHALVLLVMLLPLLPYMHPRMATEYYGPEVRRRLEPPGFLALHYGYRTPLTTVLAHALYGAILGARFAF